MQRSDYLDYGGAEAALSLNLEGTQRYLESLGFGRGDLSQARAAMESRTSEPFVLDALGNRYCDFCYAIIMGGEYEELKDGRDRCSRCSRSVLNTHERFVDEFHQVRSNMEIAFGISLGAPMILKMVNAREIAKKTGETFTPTAGVDPRVLGYATRTKNGQELYIENGAPRLAAVTTMAHELTHVWQFANWNEAAILGKYGTKNRLPVYEGMATWVQIQYLYFMRDVDYAQRQQAYALSRDDEYGDGFRIFLDRYPLRLDGDVDEDSPFKGKFPL